MIRVIVEPYCQNCRYFKPYISIKVIQLFQNTILLFAAKMIQHVHMHVTN